MITGSWGIGQFLNPHWGMINLWNKCISQLNYFNLKILFCLPIDYQDNEYNYKYFNKYLVGQIYNGIDFNKLNQAKKEIDILSNISKDEQIIKDKIYGMVWGVALAERNSYYINSCNYEFTGKKFTFFADPDDLPIEFYEQ